MNKLELIAKKLIPLDKSWTIRMGVLDILEGRDDTRMFLATHLAAGNRLSDDVEALYVASSQWKSEESKIYVGESGTLYRALQFADWLMEGGREFITEGTLTERRKTMTQDPKIVTYPLERLLELDDETTQWATAALLCGRKEKIDTGKDKLLLTYEAVDHWNQKVDEGAMWDIRYDDTIACQAAAFLYAKKTGKVVFDARQPEDYCFARAFGIINTEGVPEYRKKWSSLAGHESNRFDEMEKALQQYEAGEIVSTRDHRVVQAVAMLADVNGKKVEFETPGAVSKSCPEFWDFMAYSKAA